MCCHAEGFNSPLLPSADTSGMKLKPPGLGARFVENTAKITSMRGKSSAKNRFRQSFMYSIWWGPLPIPTRHVPSIGNSLAHAKPYEVPLAARSFRTYAKHITSFAGLLKRYMYVCIMFICLYAFAFLFHNHNNPL